MNYLNLDKKKTNNTVNELNILLADFHLYYQKLRNFHWNIVGKSFYDVTMIDTLIEDHATLLKQMRKVVDVADEAKDEGTIDMIGAYIRELEKTTWMLDAWRMKSSDNHPKV